jgi:rSAM/selenodomain-associated transferase 1
VKTRLIGELTAEQSAELHAAFLSDVLSELRCGDFHLRVAWALDQEELDFPQLPEAPRVDSVRQEGDNLGSRLYHGLAVAAERFDCVAAVGSDHPELLFPTVEDAFSRLAGGAEVVLGPSEDGGYFLVGARREALVQRLFEDVPWSTNQVCATTLERCRELGLVTELLPMGRDVDVAEDLHRLSRRLAGETRICPRTRELLKAWGRLG